MKVQSRELMSKRLIGKGSSSIVYETTWEKKSYARKDFLGVPSEIFEEEAKVLVGLGNHANVVGTHCWTVDEESCSLVIDLMDDDLLNMMQRIKASQRKKLKSGSGPSDASQTTSHVIDLNKFIEDRMKAPVAKSSESVASPLVHPFDMEEALQIMRQIAEGMAFLHGKELVHGDLKPKNILVKLSGRGVLGSLDQKVAFEVKVADFGLRLTKMKSRTLVSSQARHLEMFRWRAPELFDLSLLQRGNEHESSMDSDLEWDSDSSDGKTSLHFDKVPTKYSDVYSFGLTCWQILSGEDPYTGSGLNDLVSTVSVPNGLRPRLPPAYPAELRDLIQLCLGDEDKRPSFYVILEHLKALQTPLTRTDSLVDIKKGIAGSPLEHIEPLQFVSKCVTVFGEPSGRAGVSSNLLPVLEINQEAGGLTSITTVPKIPSLCDLNMRESGLASVPESSGKLSRLEVFDMSEYEKLGLLPDSFGGLAKLKELKLFSCGIESLPEWFGELTNLEVLDMSHCEKLRHLPDSFGGLAKLKELKLFSCGIESLPKSFGELTNLEVLDMSHCEKLRHLSGSFGGLAKLKELKLFSCGIESLPESFGELTNLEVLGMSHCEKLRHLPDSFGGLAKLKELKLFSCGIESLPESFGELTNLEVLGMSHCEKLCHLPDSFGGLAKLKELKLFSCGIESLPESFGELTSLRMLNPGVYRNVL